MVFTVFGHFIFIIIRYKTKNNRMITVVWASLRMVLYRTMIIARKLTIDSDQKDDWNCQISVSDKALSWSSIFIFILLSFCRDVMNEFMILFWQIKLSDCVIDIRWNIFNRLKPLIFSSILIIRCDRSGQ